MSSEIWSVYNHEVEYEPELFIYNGSTWGTKEAYNLYFKTYYNQSQELYGLREEKQSQSNIKNRDDAQTWADSYLASKDYPAKKIDLDIKEQREVLETDPPLGVAAVRDPLLEEDEVEEFEVRKFSYKITENGMSASIPLGELRPDVADLLSLIEDKIETNKEL